MGCPGRPGWPEGEMPDAALDWLCQQQLSACARSEMQHSQLAESQPDVESLEVWHSQVLFGVVWLDVEAQDKVSLYGHPK